MNEYNKISHAGVTSLHKSKVLVLRYVVVKDRRRHRRTPCGVERRVMEYYTGNHTSPETVWSTDPRDAMLYTEMKLGTADVMALQQGRLPGGRQGVSSKYPYPEPPLDHDEVEGQPRW